MPSARELLKRHNLAPKKSWGQNFLTDPNTLRKLAGAIDLQPDDDPIIEIGAGTGALTDHLIDGQRLVIAIERDRDMVEVLREKYEDKIAANELILEEANAVKFDFPSIADKYGKRIKVVGNLPYQLSAPILFRIMKFHRSIKEAHFLLQKEVALRLAAKPGTKDYSIYSVLFSRLAMAEISVNVKKTCFFPPPKVDSSFVAIRFHESIEHDFPDQFFIDFIKASFHKRRKTLQNSLKKQPFFKVTDDILQALASEFPDEMSKRAETIPVETFVEMTEFLYRQGISK